MYAFMYISSNTFKNIDTVLIKLNLLTDITVIDFYFSYTETPQFSYATNMKPLILCNKKCLFEKLKSYLKLSINFIFDSFYGL